MVGLDIDSEECDQTAHHPSCGVIDCHHHQSRKRNGNNSCRNRPTAATAATIRQSRKMSIPTMIGILSRTCICRRYSRQNHKRRLLLLCISILLCCVTIINPSHDESVVVDAFQTWLRYTAVRYDNRNYMKFTRQYETRLGLLYLETGNEESPILYHHNHTDYHPTRTTFTMTTTASTIDDPPLTYQHLQQQQQQKSLSSFSSSSASSTEGLSRFHQSMLRHSGMNRQRFVTGRYPMTVSFRKNPTRKWLNLRTAAIPSVASKRPDATTTATPHVLAETEVYINGTLASQSLASLDRFYWYDDHERRTLQQDYGMISMELLAEIHVDRPGYVNILSSRGAGRQADTSYKIRQEQIQTGHRWTVQAMNLLKSYNEGHLKISHSVEGAPVPKRPLEDNNHKSRFIEMLEGITSTTSVEEDRLWVTGFALTGRQGSITAIDCQQCFLQPLNERSKSTMLWPNEVQEIPNTLLTSPSQQSEFANQYQDAILVCDGFLVPTKDRGGIYVVKNPGHETEWTISLTKPGDRWFYHRAVWMDLTGDGRQSILTARCQVSTVLDTRKTGDGMVTSGVTKSGQLLWLECPKPAAIDPISGTPLESDGTIFDPFNTRHLPWKERVLTTGPDVMFAVADLDTSDDTIEVLASEFFNKQVTLTSIQCGTEPKVAMKKIIDDQSGQAFGCILANLNTGVAVTERTVVNAGSTVNCLQSGNFFSHLLVTSHECKYDDIEEFTEKGSGDAKSTTVNGYDKIDAVAPSKNPEGGSLFAYCVPEGKNSWRTEPWQRTTVASGFKVRDKLNNMINPGAPGFVYTFYANLKDATEKVKRPLIAVAGDCAESAFIFRPSMENSEPSSANNNPTNYKLMAEIQCEATVGSIGIGYNDFSSVEQERGYAKLYIPCFEADKIMVFGLGSGEDDDETKSW